VYAPISALNFEEHILLIGSVLHFGIIAFSIIGSVTFGFHYLIIADAVALQDGLNTNDSFWKMTSVLNKE